MLNPPTPSTGTERRAAPPTSIADILQGPGARKAPLVAPGHAAIEQPVGPIAVVSSVPADGSAVGQVAAEVDAGGLDSEASDASQRHRPGG